MQSSARRPASHPQPRPQGDGSPEPVYTVDLPESGVQVRVSVRPLPQSVTKFTRSVADETDGTEAGYGHGV